MLLCEPATTPLKALVDHTLLTPSASSAVFRQRAGLDGLRLADALGMA